MHTVRPQKVDFLNSIKTGIMLPIYAEIGFPGLTSILALESLSSEGYPIFFESIPDCKEAKRYSFVSVNPYLIFKSYGDEVEISLPETPAGKYGKRATMRRKPLEKLKELLSNYQTERIAGLPPFTGGAIGLFSYDFARQHSVVSRSAKTDIKILETYFAFVDMVLAFDHSRDKAWVIVNPGAREQELGFRHPAPEQGERYYDEAVSRIADVVQKLEKASKTETRAVFPTSDDTRNAGPLIPDLTRSEFENRVRRCKDSILKGNLCRPTVSLRFSAATDSQDVLQLHTILHKNDASSSVAHFDFKDLQTLSFSHDRLVRCHDGIVDVKLPTMTHPQGGAAGKVIEQPADTIVHMYAENNGLGAILNPGSIIVKKRERTGSDKECSTASTMQGVLKQGRNSVDLISAAFSGAMRTDDPEAHCMEIPGELEPATRGLFAGVVGYFSNNGDMDFNIASATITVKDGKKHVQVGALVTGDSDPTDKYFEVIKEAELFGNILQKRS